MNHPGCYTTGEPKPRAEWAIDQAKSCMNASAPEWWAALLRAEPGCEGCARAERAKRVFWADQGPPPGGPGR